VKPYYSQDGVTIYHGDCRSVLSSALALRQGASTFDLLLTDPPYGIGEARGKNASRTNVAVARDYGTAAWDDKPATEALAAMRSLCRWQIVFGGNYYDLPPTSCWLVWDKDNGANDFADCGLAWTNLKKAVRKLTYRWNGMLQQPGVPREHRQHPTQKPEQVMRWALGQAPSDVRTVLDPFMGSGTTLVAAKRLGLCAVGIEREEQYCEIAANRLSQGSLFVAGDDTPTALPISGGLFSESIIEADGQPQSIF
jgi:DNA modification methylase